MLICVTFSVQTFARSWKKKIESDDHIPENRGAFLVQPSVYPSTLHICVSSGSCRSRTLTQLMESG